MVQKAQPPKHIGQVKGGVDLVGSHRRLRRIHYHILVAMPLDERGSFYLVAFEVDDMVVLGFGALGFETLLEGVEFDGVKG